MKTGVTEILGIKYPTIQGGMQHLGVPELVSAISETGGLDTINVITYPDPKDSRRAIQKVKEMTGRPFVVNISLISSPRPGKELLNQVNVIPEEGVPAVETAGVSPQELANILNVHKNQVGWIHEAACVKHTEKAESMGADFITMAGFEVAGHPHMDGMGAMTPANRATREVRVPVLAAGGIADGRGLLAALSPGREGVVMEARFVTNKECLIHQSQEEWIVNSDESRTALCQKGIRNTVRVTDNEAAREYLKLGSRGASLEELMSVISGKRGKAACEGGDVDEDMSTVGSSYELTHKVKTCGEILDSIMEEVGQCLDRLSVVQGSR